MDETGDRPAPFRRGIGPALAQVGLAGLVGAMLVPAAPGLLLGVAFGGGLSGLVVAGGVYALLFAGVLAGVSLLGRDESWLTGHWGGRVLWGLLVGGIGIGLWVLAWRISDEAGLGFSRSSSVWVPLTAVPFAVVAGLLLRRWYLALGALVAFAGTCAFLLHALAATVPSELHDRLAAASGYVQRESFLVARVPGYHPLPDQHFWQLVPDERGAYTASVDVRLSWEPDKANIPDCDPYLTYEDAPTCEVERPGLSYLLEKDRHTYYHRAFGQRFVLSGPTLVDRAALREAMLAVRPGEGESTYVTTVPEYTLEGVSPMGAGFSPNDKTVLPGARNILFRTGPQANEGEDFSHPVQQEVESPVLRYERFTNEHRYVRLVNGVELSVKGGMAVSRDVLRTAALDARPATDDELLEVLPPVPRSQKDRTVMGAVRELARDLFG